MMVEDRQTRVEDVPSEFSRCSCSCTAVFFTHSLGISRKGNDEEGSDSGINTIFEYLYCDYLDDNEPSLSLEMLEEDDLYLAVIYPKSHCSHSVLGADSTRIGCLKSV
ncbi:hypothetical protein E1B28_004965 [Marasmius oreades]|uniref:Uncharacterized protein n=1 Tax=Marasmius oreades TaxID=181124 RepID=A0A9P8ADM8_9AGAR|nr:uncharacterized protein E1B28_004965 [Marasmius oreades]KAG7097633.1 hypothetical protein E1B28_004965 [Marasmius oreades]